MPCQSFDDVLICPAPNTDSGTVWWDTGGGTIWDFELGNFSDWATVIVALIAIRTAWRASTRSNELQAALVRVETERENRAEAALRERVEAERRAVQADHVAGWHGGFGDYPRMMGDREFGTLKGPRVGLRNGSGLPVYDVEIEVLGPEQGHVRGRRHVGTLGPDTETFRGYPSFDAETRVSTGPDGVPQEYVEQPSDLAVGLRFRDAAGNRWHRDEDGVLTFQGRASTLADSARTEDG